MAKIEIYTTPFCGYCARAKSLLDSKGAEYEETDVMMDDKKRSEMRSKAELVARLSVYYLEEGSAAQDENLRDLAGVAASAAQPATIVNDDAASQTVASASSAASGADNSRLSRALANGAAQAFS